MIKIGWFEHYHMKLGDNFVKFDDDEGRRILSPREYDNWIKENGITNRTHRIIYYKTKEGYAIKDSNKGTTLLIPNDILELDYNEFTRKMQQDLKAD